MNEPKSGGAPESRRHFLVDINTVFSLFGKRYFVIFYLGRHLHPRQREQLVNQHRVGNGFVLLLLLLLFAGFVYGMLQMAAWRMNNAQAPGSAGSFTERHVVSQTVAL